MTAATLHLNLGASRTEVELRQPGAPPRRWTLSVGHDNLWPLGRGHPSPWAIENAIQVIEDQIEGVLREVPPGAELLVEGQSLVALRPPGVALGVPRGQLSLTDIETAYQGLAARSVSAPSAIGSGFDDPRGDALVLIVRECMHHGGFQILHLEG